MAREDIPACTGCRGEDHRFDLTMAFQPIMDVKTGRPFAYEALVRGCDGASAYDVLRAVSPAARYAFDQQCRVVAIKTAVAAGIVANGAKLSINFLPNAVYSPAACIQLTLKTARATGLPEDRLIFEFTENEKISDPGHITGIVETYRRMGFATAIDDFGAGHAGLNLLARFRPDIIKLDMDLVRGVDLSLHRRIIIDAVVKMAAALDILVVGEGIETEAEFAALRALGVRYIQGFLLARPMIAALPVAVLPGDAMMREVAG